LFRFPEGAAAALAALLSAAPVHADAVLDVSGRVVATEPRFEVSVTLTNRGDRRARPIDVSGELDRRTSEARLAGGLEPGASALVTLGFAAPPHRPGLHALTLLLEHALDGAPDGAGNPPLASERAWLMLAIGASPAEAVRIEAFPLKFDVRGSLRVRLSSREGEAVRVRLRALAPRGLRAEEDAVDVSVPPRGAAEALVPLIRTGAARGSRQALLLVAETPDGPLARTAVAVAAVDVSPDASRVAALRPFVLAAGLMLLVVAVGYEAWRRRRTADGGDA